MQFLKKTVVAAVLASVSLFSFAASTSSCSGYNTTTKSCAYKPSNAISYATTYAINGTGNTGFPDYTGYGGDCTNFASSVVMSGLVGSTNPNTVVNNAKYFALGPNWYYRTSWDRGTAWTGANEFHNFVKTTRSKGMKFAFITKDSPTQALNFSAIQVGDLMFLDDGGNGVVEHTMIVTQKIANSYAGIKVSYRNSVGILPQLNRALSTFNSPTTVFLVYRPINYQD